MVTPRLEEDSFENRGATLSLSRFLPDLNSPLITIGPVSWGLMKGHTREGTSHSKVGVRRRRRDYNKVRFTIERQVCW